MPARSKGKIFAFIMLILVWTTILVLFSLFVTFGWIAGYWIAILILGLDLLSLIWLFTSNKHIKETKRVWLIIILFIPYYGSFIYFLWGTFYIENEPKLQYSTREKNNFLAKNYDLNHNKKIFKCLWFL